MFGDKEFTIIYLYFSDIVTPHLITIGTFAQHGIANHVVKYFAK
ncbi:hypothetical protein [Jeotgalibacillus sp. JSM ZJ347]